MTQIETSPVAPAIDQADIGLVGLGVMGENLALNIADHGFRVVVWNRSAAKAEHLIARATEGQRLLRAVTLNDVIAALAPPRRILLMVPAGPAVDEVLDRLVPLLAPGDVLVDGGNSFFGDTRRRASRLSESAIHYVGLGVSGGEAGARHGPSLMPGGPRRGYELLQPVLEAIAAVTESGRCVTYVGPNGAGHFVKMAHNGIEYGVMQLIAEAYDLLRRGLGLSPTEAAAVFETWGRGPGQSYLIDVTARVLMVRDSETGRPLVDMIQDAAGQKGTGKWTVEAALELGVPIPTVTAAIDARLLSALKAERQRASEQLACASLGTRLRPLGDPIAVIGESLVVASLCAYAQGMSLIRVASERYKWQIDLREIARIWKGGCIIRARALDAIMRAYDRAPLLPNLLLDTELGRQLREAEHAWRDTVQFAVERGIPAPALSASLAYFDGYRSAILPQNLVQAQRDYFGAHGYRRIDRADVELIHTQWGVQSALPDA